MTNPIRWLSSINSLNWQNWHVKIFVRFRLFFQSVPMCSEVKLHYQPTFISSLLHDIFVPSLTGYTDSSLLCPSLFSSNALLCESWTDSNQQKCSLVDSFPVTLVNRSVMSISIFCDLSASFDASSSSDTSLVPIWTMPANPNSISLHPDTLVTPSLLPSSTVSSTEPLSPSQSHDISDTMSNNKPISFSEFCSYLQTKLHTPNCLVPKAKVVVETQNSKVPVHPKRLVPIETYPFIKKYIIYQGDCAILPSFGLQILLPRKYCRRVDWKNEDLIKAIVCVLSKKWTRQRAAKHFHVPYQTLIHYLNMKVSFIKNKLDNN